MSRKSAIALTVAAAALAFGFMPVGDTLYATDLPGHVFGPYVYWRLLSWSSTASFLGQMGAFLVSVALRGYPLAIAVGLALFGLRRYQPRVMAA